MGALVSRLHLGVNYNRGASLMQNAETLKNRGCYLVPSHLEDPVGQWLHSYRQCIAVYLLKTVALMLLSFSFLLVCIYTRVHVCVCMQTWEHTRIILVCGGQRSVWWLSELLSTVCFKTGSLTEPAAHWLLRPTGQQGILLSPRVCTVVSVFLCGCGKWAQVLKLALSPE